MKNRCFLFPLLLLTALVCLLVQTALAQTPGKNPDDILIVANKGVSVDKVSLKELKSIFLKKRTSWKNGGKVVAIHARVGTPIRNAFTTRVLGLDNTREQAYWQDMMVKSGVKQPPALGNRLKAVFKLSGGVSYIYRVDYKPNVSKVLLVIRSSTTETP